MNLLSFGEIQWDIVSDKKYLGGAGDSFGAAFLVKYMENKSYGKCLEFASKISSLVCSKAEAVPENMSEIISFAITY